MIRPFSWGDIPTLHRYRKRGLCLDSALTMTRGSALVAGVLFSPLISISGVFTWVYTDDSGQHPKLLGQIIHAAGSSFARVSYLAPEDALEAAGIPPLLERLARHAGQRGAFHMLAEIDERSLAFEALRRAGFAIYARQRFWKPPTKITDPVGEAQWRVATEKDRLAVQALYQNLVPGLVQQVEILPATPIQGLVFRQDGDLVGFIELKYGPRGIWAQPLIHPDLENVSELLDNLVQHIHFRRNRPLYFCVRTYQSWLEPAMRDLEAEPGELQAVMVKHLAAHKKVTRPFALPNLEGRPEATTPIAQSKQNNGEFGTQSSEIGVR
jgi:hypothetical protein